MNAYVIRCERYTVPLAPNMKTIRSLWHSAEDLLALEPCGAGRCVSPHGARQDKTWQISLRRTCFATRWQLHVRIALVIGTLWYCLRLALPQRQTLVLGQHGFEWSLFAFVICCIWLAYHKYRCAIRHGNFQRCHVDNS